MLQIRAGNGPLVSVSEAHARDSVVALDAHDDARVKHGDVGAVVGGEARDHLEADRQLLDGLPNVARRHR